MMHVVRLALLALVTTGCANMLGFTRHQTYAPDGLATYSLPKQWPQRGRELTPEYALYEHRRSQRWWLGAGDPLEVHAWTIIASPSASDGALQAALDDALRRVSSHTQQFPAFGSLRDGDRETWIHEGSYQISSLHDPEKVLFVRSIDRARKVGFVARVYERRIAHERLLRTARDFFASLTPAPAPARDAFFREVGDWPTVRAGRVAREREQIDAILRAEGLPPARPGETVAHDGWVYTLTDRDFIIGRLLGSRVMTTPGYGARVELSWLRWRGEWKAWRASRGARAPRGEPELYSAAALARWATAGDAELDRDLAWFYTVHECRLTAEEWEPPREGPAACGLAAWLPQAQRIEAQFRAGELFVE